MGRKIKLGFIGTGMMGRSHIDAIQKHFSSEAEVSAICDTNKEELEKGKKLAPEARSFSNWEDLLNEDLDGVIISTPTHTHAKISIAALNADKYVLSEKPVAINREECWKMVKASEKSNKSIMIGHELRYSQYWAKIKEIVDSGLIGTPHLHWWKEFRCRFLPKIDNWIQDKRRSGGALVDKNCHHFDLMNWYLNKKPKTVAAFGGTDVVKVIKNKNEVEDNAVVIVNYEKKARAALLLCMFAPIYFPEPLEFGIFGDKGFLGTIVSENKIIVIPREREEDVEEVNRRFKYKKEANDTITYFVAPVKGDYGGHTGFIEEHREFLEVIKTGKKPLTEVKECVYGTLIPIAAEESIEKNKEIKI